MNRAAQGQSASRTIKQHIAHCDAVLFVLSPDALDSPWFQEELTLAREEKKPLLPLLLKDCGTKLPIALKEIKYADFRDGRQAGWRELEQGLSRWSTPPERQAQKARPPEDPLLVRQVSAAPVAPRSGQKSTSSLRVGAALVLVAGGMGLTLANKGASSRPTEPPGSRRKSMLAQLVEAIQGSTSPGNIDPSSAAGGAYGGSYPSGVVGSASSLADLRRQDQVRPLQSSEVNLTVDRLPTGSFGFVASTALRALRRARLEPVESATSFEIHKTSTGQLLLVGYTSEAASSGAARNQPTNLSLVPKQNSWAQRAISIPLDRLKGVSFRVEQGQEVADLVLGVSLSAR